MASPIFTGVGVRRLGGCIGPLVDVYTGGLKWLSPSKPHGDRIRSDRKTCQVFIDFYIIPVFAKINAHPEINAHQKQWFFKGGSTQNRWALMGDFSKGGVHKTDGFSWVIFQGVHETDGFSWVIFQRGEYTKPMVFLWALECFFIASKS